jgi:hypothetical protein
MALFEKGEIQEAHECARKVESLGKLPPLSEIRLQLLLGRIEIALGRDSAALLRLWRLASKYVLPVNQYDYLLFEDLRGHGESDTVLKILRAQGRRNPNMECYYQALIDQVACGNGVDVSVLPVFIE